MSHGIDPGLHRMVVHAAIMRGAAGTEQDRIAAWCARESGRVDHLVDDLLLLIRASALLDEGLSDGVSD